MKCRKSYKDEDRFKQYRNAYKNRYTQRRNFSDGFKHWKEEEIQIVMEHNMTDTEIAKLLKRSITAIQNKRNKEKVRREGLL